MKFRKSSLISKILILAILVYGTATLVSLRAQITEQNETAQALAMQVEELEQRNEKLQESIEILDTDEGIKNVARDKLGLVEDGEVVFYDIGE